MKKNVLIKQYKGECCGAACGRRSAKLVQNSCCNSPPVALRDSTFLQRQKTTATGHKRTEKQNPGRNCTTTNQRLGNWDSNFEGPAPNMEQAERCAFPDAVADARRFQVALLATALFLDFTS